MNVGYIRVSTKQQHIARQADAMEGLDLDRIYIDRESGKDFERTEYQRMVSEMSAGDVLYIKSLDRFGRNYDQILDQWRLITKEIGADIVVLDMPLLNTHTADGLTGKLISDIVLQLLAYVAETERAMNKERQKEGIAAAKAKGQKFGRPEAEIPEECLNAVLSKKISCIGASKKYGLSYSTLGARVRKIRKEGASCGV